MCRSTRQVAHTHRASAWVALAAALLLQGIPARAADDRTGNGPAADKRVMGEIIDVTGMMERPRGDTRLPWTLPEGFGREPDVPFGRALHDEVLTPVDRNELIRLLEVERTLGR